MVRTRKRRSTTTNARKSGAKRTAADVTVEEISDHGECLPLRRSTRNKSTAVPSSGLSMDSRRLVTPSPSAKEMYNKERNGDDNGDYTGSSGASARSPVFTGSASTRNKTIAKSPASRKLFPKKRESNPKRLRNFLTTRTAFSTLDDADMLSLASCSAPPKHQGSTERRTAHPSSVRHKPTTIRQRTLKTNRKRNLVTCSIDSLALISAPVPLSPSKSEVSSVRSKNTHPLRTVQGAHRTAVNKPRRNALASKAAGKTVAARSNAISPREKDAVTKRKEPRSTKTAAKVTAAPRAAPTKRTEPEREKKQSSTTKTATSNTAAVKKLSLARRKVSMADGSRDEIESESNSEKSSDSDSECDNSTSSPTENEPPTGPRSVPEELVRLLAPAAGPVPENLRPTSKASEDGAPKWKRSNFGNRDDGSDDRNETHEGEQSNNSLPSLRPRAKLPYTARGYSYFQESDDDDDDDTSKTSDSDCMEANQRKSSKSTHDPSATAASVLKRKPGRPRKQQLPKAKLYGAEEASPPVKKRREKPPKNAPLAVNDTDKSQTTTVSVPLERGRGRPRKDATTGTIAKKNTVPSSSPTQRLTTTDSSSAKKVEVGLIEKRKEMSGKASMAEPFESVLASVGSPSGPQDPPKRKRGRPPKKRKAVPSLVDVSDGVIADERASKRRRHAKSVRTSDAVARRGGSPLAASASPVQMGESMSKLAARSVRHDSDVPERVAQNTVSRESPVRRRDRSTEDWEFEAVSEHVHQRTSDEAASPVTSPVRRQSQHMSSVQQTRRKSKSNLPKSPKSPVRRRMHENQDMETDDSRKVCRFDSSTKKLIIDTASVPESVVNAITNQVQACLDQAKSPGGPAFQELNGASLPSPRLNLLNVGLAEPAVTSTAIDDDDDEGHGMVIVGLQDHGFDSRSVTSELTHDFSRIGYHGGNAAFPRNASRRHLYTSRYAEDEDDFMGGGHFDDDGVSIDNRDRKQAEIPSKKIAAPLRTKPLARDDSQSVASSRRRQMFWNCSDSLAGSLFGMPQRQSKQSFISQQKSVPEVPIAAPTNAAPRTLPETETTEPTGSDRAAATSSANELYLGGSYACGKCSGCLRPRDCQTCENCLSKLRRYGTMPPPMGEHEGCLKRRCLRARCIGRADVLMGGLGSAAVRSHKENGEAVSETPRRNLLTLPERKSDLNDNPSDESSNDEASGKVAGSQLSKKLLAVDNDDDWSVDYSYLSEADYRDQLLGKSSSRQRSSVSSLASSKRSWLFPFSRKLRRGGGSLGGRRKRSSVSSSSRKAPPTATGPVTGVLGAVASTNSDPSSTMQSGKKGKRDPLYDLSLLQPNPRKETATSTLSPLVAWTDTPKSLQAMVQYDEADQDWV